MSVIEIAKLAQVSVGTVSNVINGKPAVSAETARRVQHAIEKIGYIPRAPEKRPGPKKSEIQKTHKVAFIRWKGDAFCISVAKGIKQYLNNANIGYLVEDVAACYERVLDAIAHPGNGVDGLILMPYDDEGYRRAVQEALGGGVRIVFIDRYLPGIEASMVSTDHFSGAFQATLHLLKKHDCPVYYLGTGPETTSCTERINGWSEAMFEYNFWDTEKYKITLPLGSVGLALRQSHVFNGSYKAALQLFMSCKEEKYCIFCVNDYAACGVYKAAKSANLSIGRDVFIVGFDNIPMCERLDVPLSSVTQDVETIGYEAAKILHEHLQGKLKRPAHLLLPAELFIRASSIDGVAYK